MAFLVAIACVIAGGIASQGSYEYLVITRYEHGYLIQHALKATGALMIGIGILPLDRGGRSCSAHRGETRRELRVLRCVLVAALLSVRPLHGGQGRLQPVHVRDARVGAEHDLRRAAALRRDRGLASIAGGSIAGPVAAGSRGLGLFLVLWTPYLMGVRFSRIRPGLAIRARRTAALRSRRTMHEVALLVVWALSVAVLFAAARSSGCRAPRSGRARGRRRRPHRVEPDRRALGERGLQLDQPHVHRQHPHADELAGAAHARRADALPRPADGRPERRVAARVLESVA